MSNSGIKCFSMCMLICIVICFLPIFIVSIVISQHYKEECDTVDLMGIDTKDYLLGFGIMGVTYIFFVAVLTTCIIYKCKSNCGVIVSISCMILLICNVLLFWTWFVVGAVVIFRSNVNCIRDASLPVIYAVVMWALSFALNIKAIACAVYLVIGFVEMESA